MPSISIPAAVIGSSVIGGATSLIAGSKTAGAAKDTAAANNALTLDIYNQNKATETPFINTGVKANSAQADVLGLNGGGSSAPSGWDANAFLAQHPELVSGYQQARASNPAYTEALPDYALRQYTEHPDVWSYTPPAGGSTGATSPVLRNFADTIGTAPQIKAISDTLGSNLSEYLHNTGQDKTTQQAADQIGGSFSDYTHNSGVDKEMAANDALLGVNGAGFSDYLKNSGVADTNDARSKLLGLDGGGGISTYQTNIGVKPANDAIEKFLGIGAGGMGDFLNSTGYNFNLDTGSAALQRSAASRGLLRSGALAKDLTAYGQDLGKSYGQTYLNALDNYSGLRSQQGADYSGQVGAFGAAKEGQAGNYSNLVGAQAGRREGLNTDYLNATNALTGLRRTQALDFTGQQSGLAGLNTNNFATYFGAAGDVANRGLTAANALAGVGTNMVNQVSGNNNNALAAQAGANASTANAINGTLNNALGAFAYTRGPGAAATPALSPVQAWNPYGYPGV